MKAAIHNGAEAIIVSSQLIKKGVVSEYEKLSLNIQIVLTRDMPLDIGAVDNHFPKGYINRTCKKAKIKCKCMCPIYI